MRIIRIPLIACQGALNRGMELYDGLSNYFPTDVHKPITTSILKVLVL